MARVRIVQDEDGWRWRWWMLAAAIVAVGLWQIYELGSRRGAQHVGENLDDRAALLAVQDRSFAMIEQLQTRIAALENQLSTQRKLTELEVQASAEMQKELQLALTEQRYLLTKVQFYESIVGKSASQAGVRVASIQLRPGESAGKWWLQVTLTQVKQHSVRASGDVSVAVYGKADGESQELTMAQLHPDGLTTQRFGFRYFQDLVIPLVLPENYEPSEVAVEINIKQPKASQLLEQRDWLALQR